MLMKNTLDAALMQLMLKSLATPTTSRITPAEDIADAYHKYAQGAQDSMGKVTLANLPSLKSALVVSIVKDPLTFADPAVEWATGFTAYWSGATFTMGSVVAVTGTAILATDLANLWGSFPAAIPAGGLSDILDKFTRTVATSNGPIS